MIFRWIACLFKRDELKPVRVTSAQSHKKLDDSLVRLAKAVKESSWK